MVEIIFIGCVVIITIGGLTMMLSPGHVIDNIDIKEEEPDWLPAPLEADNIIFEHAPDLARALGIKEKQKSETKKETYTYLTKIICELCGRWERSETWGDQYGKATSVNISLKKGSIYPESGSGERITTDICPTCFLEKLKP